MEGEAMGGKRYVGVTLEYTFSLFHKVKIKCTKGCLSLTLLIVQFSFITTPCRDYPYQLGPTEYAVRFSLCDGGIIKPETMLLRQENA
jgi:hypothetical protein